MQQLRQQANAVTRLLHDKRTTFMVVTTLEAAPLHEAEYFVEVLADKKYHLGAVILNKVLPHYLLDDQAARTAEALCARAAEVAAKVSEGVGDPGPEQVARVHDRRIRRASCASRWWPSGRPSSGPSWGSPQRWWRPCRTSRPTSTTCPASSSWATDLGEQTVWALQASPCAPPPGTPEGWLCVPWR